MRIHLVLIMHVIIVTLSIFILGVTTYNDMFTCYVFNCLEHT